MRTKKFGKRDYVVMPVDDVDACDEVFKLWIQEATLDHFPERLRDIHNGICDIFNCSENVRAIHTQFNTPPNSQNQSLKQELGSKTFTFSRQVMNQKDTDTSNPVYMGTKPFEIMSNVFTHNGSRIISCRVCFIQSERRHTVVEAEGTDIDNLTIKSFIPGNWITDFYALTEDLKLLMQPEQIEKHRRLKEFKEEFAGFGILENDM